jgi:hypothetical protein
MKITQEFALARRIILMAGDVDIKIEDITGNFLDNPAPYHATVGFREAIVLDLESSQEPERSNIFQLLRLFHDKLCSNPRDRIFSLLALCDDRCQFEVNYDITPKELVGNLLHNYKDPFCLCAVDLLDNILEIERLSHLSSDLDMSQPPFAYVELPVLSQAALEMCKPADSYAVYNSTLRATNDRRTNLWAHMSLRDLCTSGHGSLTMSMSSTSSSTTSFDSAADEITYEHTNCTASKTIYGGMIDVTDDYTFCMIKISLDMLLELARVLHLSSKRTWRACGGRVTNGGWDQNGNSREPILRLYHRASETTMIYL